MSPLDVSTLAQWLPERPHDAHKGMYGHALVVAGSKMMPGAAILALLALRRSGVGRITWLVDDDTVLRAHSLPPEVLLRPRPPAGGDAPTTSSSLWDMAVQDASAVLVGPGLDSVDSTRAGLVACGAMSNPVPICIDADGLRLVAAQPGLLTPLHGRVVLTPHPKEMAALCGVDTEKVQTDRVHWAQRLAEAHQAIVVLKGAGTVVAGPEQAPVTLDVGGPELSHAGTGDVLAGLLTGLLAQQLPLFVAAKAAALAHAIAGARAREKHGMAGTTPSDVAEALGAVWQQASR